MNLHTKEIFDSAYRDRSWSFYRSLVAECIKYGEPGKWLDLGSGLGLFVECAQKFGIDCEGIEGAEYAIKNAQSRGIVLHHQLLENRYPFEDCSISTVICNQIIEHLYPNTVKFMLRESYRVLKSGGIIFVYSPSKFDRVQRKAKTHINLYTPTRLKHELESAGFIVFKMPNSPINFLGSTPIPKKISEVIFKLFPFELLSASANCIARKP